MKVFIPALVAVAAANDEKKVPPRHPLQRLNKLTMFTDEWCNDNLTAKQAKNWSRKFAKNAARMVTRFEKCGFYDENLLPHGGPAKRDTDAVEGALSDEDFRYDKNNPVRGIKQITNGFRKWAERYISTCQPNQPTRQVDRMEKWHDHMIVYLKEKSLQ